MTIGDEISYFKVGLAGVTVFLGGGLATYAIMKYANHQSLTVSQQKLNELTNELVQLKKEVAELNKNLPRNVEDLKLNLDSIKKILNERRSLKSSSASLCSYQTAWSEDEDELDADDEEFTELHSKSLDGDVSPKPNGASIELTRASFFTKIDVLSDGSNEDKEAAMRIMHDNESLYKDDWEFMWRMSRSHIAFYEMKTMHEEKKAHAYSGTEYAKRALDLHEASSDVHKWYAISIGTLTDFVSTKDKIQYGHDLKKHVERALELNPNEPILHFMLGRWCWGVYMLTWIERKVASTLFATPPTSTVEDALESFLNAENIQPAFYKANQLYIGKCYYEMRNYNEAKKWLLSARDIEVLNSDDQTYHNEVLQLLAKL